VLGVFGVLLSQVLQVDIIFNCKWCVQAVHLSFK